MTGCCLSPPSVGTWKIYVRMPIYYPNMIRWNWGETWQQVEGTDYILTSNIPSNRLVYIYFFYRIKYEDGSKSGLQEDSRQVYTPYYFDIVPSQYFRLYAHNYYGNLQVVFESKIHSPNQYSDYGWIASRVDNRNDFEWTLKIFNKNNLITEEKRIQNNSPLIEQESEKCLQGEQREYVRDYQNWKTKDYCSQIIQGNQATLLLLSEQLNEGFATILLAYESSDERCSLAPQFEVECILCKKCPEGSCEIICGDTVCCVDENGNAIDSFPVQELC